MTKAGGSPEWKKPYNFQGYFNKYIPNPQGRAMGSTPLQAGIWQRNGSCSQILEGRQAATIAGGRG
jgi:hypothetical protein